VGSKEGETPVGTSGHPVQAGTGHPGPPPIPSPAGAAGGWGRRGVAGSVRGVQHSNGSLLCASAKEGPAVGWDVAALGIFLPVSCAVFLALCLVFRLLRPCQS